MSYPITITITRQQFLEEFVLMSNGYAIRPDDLTTEYVILDQDARTIKLAPITEERGEIQ